MCNRSELKHWYMSDGNGRVLAVANGSQPIGTSLLYRKVEADQVMDALEARLARVNKWVESNDDLASAHHIADCMQDACPLCDAISELNDILADTGQKEGE